MGNIDLSIVMATDNRSALLERSLKLYTMQNFPLDRMELVIIDDWTDDFTPHLLKHYAKVLNIVRIIPPYKLPGTWRDCAATLNIALRAARGNFIVATHPEVMPGLDSLRLMYERKQEHVYLSCRPYYLTPLQQQQIDTVPWMIEGPVAVRKFPDFYNQAAVIAGGPDYSPRAIETLPSWDSWVFGGMTRDTWKWFGGFAENNSWGTIDVDFLNRRNLLNIPNITLTEDSAYCVHQNHDHLSGVPATPRDMTLAMGNLRQYMNTEEARLNNL